MIKSKLFVIISISVVFLFVSSPVFAQLQAPTGGDIKLGPVEIRPSIGLMETYSDNIYLSYDNKAKESDYITTLSPGIQFLLPLKRHSFQVGYKADINRYSDNDETDYTNHLFGWTLSLDFPGGLIFTLSDYYSIATVPRKWKEQAGVSGSGDPYRELDYKANVLNAKVRYNFVDRWAVAVWYNNYDFDYEESYNDSGSYNRNLGGGSIFYRFTAKTEALIEYNYSKVD
ncbi:MAG: outer membrane beta-barrel protein, partial [Deltaproteobacteria bacterium]|nr:outer membrane beta-barrel protein [Deltaproteobacteria bacterium]